MKQDYLDSLKRVRIATLKLGAAMVDFYEALDRMTTKLEQEEDDTDAG